MYFAIDLDNWIITAEGDTFTKDQFRKVVEHAFENGKFLDMTLMTQRFVAMGYDFDALEKYYKEAI